MAPIAGKARITPLLSNETLSRVERMRLCASRRFTNRSRGEHKAAASGSSIEFRDYRDYSAGDDIRFVDWNIYARLRRGYVKLYHQEEEMHVALIVDASASMGFEGKVERARQLAAAFGVMGLLSIERVSVNVFSSRESKISRMNPRSGRASMRDLFRFIEPIEAGGDCALEAGVEEVLKHHRGRGVALILSDFLTAGTLKRSFNRLYSAGLEVFGVQVLGPTEIDPDVSGDLRFVDSETTGTLDVSSAGDLLGLYQEYRLAHQRMVEQMCTSRGGRFLCVNAGDTMEYVLFDLLRRKGWVR
jgi:uncharacterized protein (DUF58 family)